MDLSIDPTFDSLLDQLLENEKVDACRWLRTEMDSLVSPFIDQLFRKLKIKLTTGLKLQCGDDVQSLSSSSKASSSRSNVRSIMNSTFHHHHLPSSSSTSFSSSSQSSSAHHHQIESSSSSLMNFEPQILIKEDFSDDDDDDDDDDDSSNSNNPIPSLTATGSSKSIYFSIHEHEDDDEECDCEDCHNDNHWMAKRGDQDNPEPVSQEPNDPKTQEAGPSQPKKFRMSLESSSNSSNSTTNPQPQQPLIQEQEEHNPPEPQVNIKEQLITLSINCIVQDCPGVCADRNELNQHLMQVHSIQKYRCIAKDCRQSFSTQKAFGAHLRAQHPTTRVWPCALCPRTFTSYYVLHNHISHNHYTGVFQCSFPGCTFIREHRGKVISHYRIHQGYACQFPNCGQTFKAAQSMKAHQRLHLGIQPYHCRWMGCGFASAARHVALGHIRKAHLNVDTILGGVAGDPRHYLRVISELL